MSDEIFRAIGRLESSLKSIKEDTNDINGELKNHSQRISAIEGFKVQVLTIAGLVGAGMSLVWDIVRSKFGA